MTLKDFTERKGIRQVEIAEVLGLDQSTVSLKLAGRRPWFVQEVAALLAFLRHKTGEDVTFEQLFGAPDFPAAANEG
jgi:transcriptional regulator with XRE-family HTH domain